MTESVHVVCPHCQAINRLPADKLDRRPGCGQCHEALFTGEPVSVDARGFRRQIGRTDIPVVVDVWASWCGPCKQFAPIFRQAAAELEPGYRLLKLNTETEQALAAELGIRSIPTLLLFRNGREVARTAGAMDQNSLLRWLRSAA